LPGGVVDPEAEREGLGLPQAPECRLQGPGVHRLPLRRRRCRSLIERCFELLAHGIRHPAREGLDPHGVGRGERREKRRGVGGFEGRGRDHGPAIAIGDRELDATGERDPPDGAVCRGRADDPLERREQLVEIRHRHQAVGCEVRAVARDHDTRRPLDVEPREAAALRGEHDQRLHHRRETGVVDLSAKPPELLLQIRIAVDGGHGEHLAFSRLHEPRPEEGGGREQAGERATAKQTGTSRAMHGEHSVPKGSTR